MRYKLKSQPSIEAMRFDYPPSVELFDFLGDRRTWKVMMERRIDGVATLDVASEDGGRIIIQQGEFVVKSPKAGTFYRIDRKRFDELSEPE